MVPPVNEIPEPWASALDEAGYIDGRYRTEQRPSTRSLAREVGVHVTTLTRMFSGTTDTDHSTVVEVARALKRSPVEVSAWARQARAEAQQWDPPAAVHQLTKREQDALTELIVAMVAARKDGEGVGNSAASTRAGESPAVEGVRMRARTPSGPLPGSPSQERKRSPRRPAQR